MASTLQPPTSDHRGAMVKSAEVTEKLRSNDPSFSRLVLDELPHHYSSDYSIFCDALKQNRTISSVVIRSPFLLNLSEARKYAVMEAIGNLSCLEELILGTVRPAPVLATALKNASRLKALRVGRLRVSSRHDMAECASALRSCTSLQEINFGAIQLVVQGNNRVTQEGKIWFEESESSKQDVELDPLFEAIASLPNLHRILLRQHLNGGRIQSPTEKSLRLLCRSPRKSLIFNSCELSNEQCFAIADELQSDALPLTELVVAGANQFGSSAWDAFTALLAVNYNIVRFDLDEDGQMMSMPSSERLAKIQYFLELNQRGRKLILCGPQASRRKAWFEFLVNGNGSLDLIFFALIADPSLYCT